MKDSINIPINIWTVVATGAVLTVALGTALPVLAAVGFAAWNNL